MIPGIHDIRDYFPNPNRNTFEDDADRNSFYSVTLDTEHFSYEDGNTVTVIADEPLRIKSVQMSAPDGGGTVTGLQVQVDGRDIFTDNYRPYSGGEPRQPDYDYIISANSVISTIIEASSGPPGGTSHVLIECEPYVLLPKFDEVELRGKDRLRPSKQQRAGSANGGRLLVEQGRVGGASRIQSNDIARQQLERLRQVGQRGRAVEGPPLPKTPRRPQPRPN